jgi:predicted O-methyltransferase YrrM
MRKIPMDYEFTENWFQHTPNFMEKVIPTLPGRDSVMEVGSYEGRSTVWFLENLVTDGGTLWAIDTWKGGEEHDPAAMKEIEARFDRNSKISMARYPERWIVKQKGDSKAILSKHLYVNSYAPWLDFVYIDGSHQAADVLTDACLVFWQVKIGGVILFDDYLWTAVEGRLHQPGPAINAFLLLFEDKIELLLKDYQLAVRRVK